MYIGDPNYHGEYIISANIISYTGSINIKKFQITHYAVILTWSKPLSKSTHLHNGIFRTTWVTNPVECINEGKSKNFKKYETNIFHKTNLSALNKARRIHITISNFTSSSSHAFLVSWVKRSQQESFELHNAWHTVSFTNFDNSNTIFTLYTTISNPHAPYFLGKEVRDYYLLKHQCYDKTSICSHSPDLRSHRLTATIQLQNGSYKRPYYERKGRSGEVPIMKHSVLYLRLSILWYSPPWEKHRTHQLAIEVSITLWEYATSTGHITKAATQNQILNLSRYNFASNVV